MDKSKIKIIRSRRRTLALEVAKDASLVVQAPFFLPLRYIQKFIQQKKRWIEKRRKEILKNKIAEKSFVEGEEFLYLGETYKLKIVDWQEKPLTFKDSFNLSRGEIDRAKDLFEEWYKKRAFEVMSERVIYYSSIFGLKYNRIRISKASKRWGSCSSTKNLNFNWRLIMAPLEVIDYVVIHELSHLVEQNHSKKFWGLVGKIMSDYKNHKKWLKDNGVLLNV